MSGGVFFIVYKQVVYQLVEIYSGLIWLGLDWSLDKM
jgi:hypothetical protein